MKKIMITAFLLLSALSLTWAKGTKTPAWLEGKWTGTGYQTDGQTWAIKLECNPGEATINAAYPSLGCGGEWKVNSVKGIRADLSEILLEGRDRCDVGTKVVIFQISKKEIAVVYYLPDYSDKAIANAVLAKE